MGAIHSTKIPTCPTGKSGPPQKVDPFFRNFSGWTEPIHSVLDRNFRKFWLNGSRPMLVRGNENFLVPGENRTRDLPNPIIPGRETNRKIMAGILSYEPTFDRKILLRILDMFLPSKRFINSSQSFKRNRRSSFPASKWTKILGTLVCI